MRKNLKKGFFLPETIVVITVVVVILLNVYVTFTSVYSNYRRSFKYNTLNALNASYSLKKYYESFGGLSSNELELNNYILDITTNEKYNSSFYEKIKSNYEIEKIYLINPTKVQDNLSNLNINLRRYIRTLKNNTEIGIVIVTKNGEYSFVPINISTSLICTYTGDLEVGAEFTNAQYTYRYKQQYNGTTWENISNDGWGVKLTDPNSTTPITTKICSSINDKPVVSSSYMFADSKAESIDLSNFNTSNIVNMQAMFVRTNVSILDLSDFNTSKVTNMSYMFQDSKALYINIENFDTSNVTNMNAMFARTNVSILDLSNFNTSRVTNMLNMFYGSANLRSINVSSFDTSNVTNMQGMFGGISVSSLDLSNFNTSKVTTMRSMFSGSGVTSLDLSNFNTSNVTTMLNMFVDCKDLKSVNLSSFDTSKVTNMQGMFARSGIVSLDLSKFNTSNVTDMNNMFLDSKDLKSVNLSSFDTSNVTNMQGMFTRSGVTSLDLSSFDTSKVTNFNNMFESIPATNGYARTQTDADRFNASTNKPSTLTFVVK